MPDLGGAAGWAALVVSGVTAYVSIKKVRVDERGSVVLELQGLVTTLTNEVARVNTRSKEREAEFMSQLEQLRTESSGIRTDCDKKIERLQVQIADQLETIQRQAHQITQLERRRTPRAEGQQ